MSSLKRLHGLKQHLKSFCWSNKRKETCKSRSQLQHPRSCPLERQDVTKYVRYSSGLARPIHQKGAQPWYQVDKKLRGLQGQPGAPRMRNQSQVTRQYTRYRVPKGFSLRGEAMTKGDAMTTQFRREQMSKGYWGLYLAGSDDELIAIQEVRLYRKSR